MAEQQKNPSAPATSAVMNNPGARRFELRSGELTAFLDYFTSGGVLHLVHTDVPRELEGRGYGAQLARAGLEYARQEGLKVAPDCPFVRGYIDRHAEYAPLIDPGSRE